MSTIPQSCGKSRKFGSFPHSRIFSKTSRIFRFFWGRKKSPKFTIIFAAKKIFCAFSFKIKDFLCTTKIVRGKDVRQSLTLPERRVRASQPLSSLLEYSPASPPGGLIHTNIPWLFLAAGARRRRPNKLVEDFCLVTERTQNQ